MTSATVPAAPARAIYAWLGGLLLAALTCGAAPADDSAMTLVVMDPLAKPLACECVEGYAQREYEALGNYLQEQLGRPIEVVFSEALKGALRNAPQGTAEVIIGKDSVVRFDAAELRIPVRRVARLTGKDGLTTQHGLFVVRHNDPAQRTEDLRGYRFFFGPPASDEKHAAALATLKKLEIDVPDELEVSEACSEGALALLELPADQHAAAVISSYAKPLLEGCGTIEKGELRVVGRTAPVPFVTAFVTDRVDAELEARLRRALTGVAGEPKLLTQLETSLGFLPVDKKKAPAAPEATEAKAGDDAAATDWPAWRGPRRDGIGHWLPRSLPALPLVMWEQPLSSPALAGVSADRRVVVVADRDVTDTQDVFRCFDANTGLSRWQLRYPAIGELDYGNSPRAAPLIHGEKVYLLGAFGHLNCVRLEDGQLLWSQDLIAQFHAKPLTWGMCNSPLIVDDKLIVYPGGEQAALAALDPDSGAVVWTAPGRAGAYASFIVATFGGKRQIVGYDKISLGGWDVDTGRRLWELIPPEPEDFNVPTPIAVDDRLLVTTENNGTRLYEFDRHGRIVVQPVAVNEDLAPDTSTPVVLGRKVIGCWGDLFCLDLDDRLETLWAGADDAYGDYVSLIGCGDRLLVTSCQGELLLLDTSGNDHHIVSRVAAFDRNVEVYSHPALVGKRLYIRGSASIRCLLLGAG